MTESRTQKYGKPYKPKSIPKARMTNVKAYAAAVPTVLFPVPVNLLDSAHGRTEQLIQGVKRIGGSW